MIELQSDEQAWLVARAGHVTASRINDVMAKGRGKDAGWGVSRANYAAELVAERLSGRPTESYTSAAMQHGKDTEAQARAAYEFIADANVSHAAFIVHPSIEWAGATPDGFVDADGLVEFKCPNTATHIDTLLSKSVPSKYIAQIQWQLACSARAWCDFVSFDPRLPERMRYFCQRVKRDDDMIGALERHVETFLAEVDDTIKRLRRQYAEAA